MYRIPSVCQCWNFLILSICYFGTPRLGLDWNSMYRFFQSKPSLQLVKLYFVLNPGVYLSFALNSFYSIIYIVKISYFSLTYNWWINVTWSCDKLCVPLYTKINSKKKITLSKKYFRDKILVLAWTIFWSLNSEINANMFWTKYLTGINLMRNSFWFIIINQL